MKNRTKPPKTLKNNIRPTCVVCGRSYADRAHVKTRGAGAGWEDHEFIYLCRHHHMEQGHLNWKRFIDKYPMVMPHLTRKGWVLVEEFGTWKFRQIKQKIEE